MHDAPGPSCVEVDGGRHGQRGFVLILVLVIVGVIAAVALVLLERSRGGVGAAADLVEVTKARGLADAGIARLVQALRVEDDPLLKTIITSPAPVPWRFANVEIRLSFLRESGRADLNAGSLELIQSLLDGLPVAPDLRQRALQQVEAARRQPAPLPSVLALLPPCQRLTPVARLFEDRFTVLTGSRGISAAGLADEQLHRISGLTSADIEALRTRPSSSIGDPQLAHLQRFLADEEPVYRLRAEAATPRGAHIVREAVILLSARTPTIRILSQRDVSEPALLSCN
ncbi:hypothetical protein [Inquilinus limosus]|uniref:Type II secretion system protein K n=1 Tax=Inquilinus limosus MP06 TaxID=1398085 RepID=A0A0A0DAS6_9PROT|nr:hypothetical protein [Inquilinus limosus]KGM34082.1 hypothetical protein P409_12170 [Inquilinus limosus MP06]